MWEILRKKLKIKTYVLHSNKMLNCEEVKRKNKDKRNGKIYAVTSSQPTHLEIWQMYQVIDSLVY